MQRTLDSRSAGESRRRELLTLLCGHPLTSAEILDLNSTFSHPFPVTAIHRRRSDGRCFTYRESRPLTNLIKTEIAGGRIKRSFYATPDAGQLPYYRITQNGFRTLTRKPITRGMAKNAVFRPITLGLQTHQRAVAAAMVHTLRQTQRDDLVVTHYVTRHQRRLELPIAAISGTDLEPYLRRDPATGNPASDSLALYPDAEFRIRLPDGTAMQFYDEIDGGTERLTGDDFDAIQKKFRFYERFAVWSKRRFTVRLLTYKPNSFERLRNVIACVGETVGSTPRGRYLFGTLERFLDANGAMTRRNVFLDQIGRPIPCVELPRQLPFSACRSAEHADGAASRMRQAS